MTKEPFEPIEETPLSEVILVGNTKAHLFASYHRDLQAHFLSQHFIFLFCNI